MVHEAEPITMGPEKKTIVSSVAEDVAYVTNHAVSCLITDVTIQPVISSFVQPRIEDGIAQRHWPNWLRHVEKLFEHDHDHDKHGFWKNLRHWMTGEIVGDVGAIPLTVMTERFAPGFMHVLRRSLEPIAGKYFRKGAERSSKAWAAESGVPLDSQETKAMEEKLYEHELKHLPQAVVWNLFSVPINLFVQKKFTGNRDTSWGTLALTKMFGSLASNAMLLSGRAISPKTFGAIDRFDEQHVSLPVTKAVMGTLGADKGTAEHVAEHAAKEQLLQKGAKPWTERSSHPDPVMER